MHANWRPAGSLCPIDAAAVSWTQCGDCAYFRGLSAGRDGFRILCNWPQTGTHRDDGPDLSFDKAAWERRMEDS